MADLEKQSPNKNDKKEQSGPVAPPGGKDVDSGGGGQKSPVDLLPLPIPRNMETPDGIDLKRSGVDNSKLGVWCTKAIKEGATFGPFLGERVTKTRKDSDPLHVWEIVDLETKEFLFYVDATRTEYGNWMRYAQCARFYEEQNIIAQQDGIDIMYKTLKPIKEGEELLTWYKMPSPKRGQRHVGRASEGRAKSLKELEQSATESLPKPGVNSSPTSSKKKSVSPASKAKPVHEEKAKGEAKKDANVKQNKNETESSQKKAKPVELKSALVKQVKPAKVKQSEVKPAKIKQTDFKQGELKPSETKPPKVKQAESKQAKVKPAEVRPAEIKSAKVKSADVKSGENKSAKGKTAENKALKVKPGEVKPGESKAVKVIPTEVKPVENRPIKVKPAEVKPVENKPVKVKPAEVKPIENKPIKVKPAEVKPIENKPIKVKPTEVKPVENKPVKVKPTEVKPVENKPVKVKPTEVKPVENKPVKVKLADIQPGEDKPVKVQPAEVKPSEVKPAEVLPVKEKHAVVKQTDVEVPEAKLLEVKPAETKQAEVKLEEVMPSEAKKIEVQSAEIRPTELKVAEVKQCAKKEKYNKTKEQVGKSNKCQEGKQDKIKSEPNSKPEAPVKFQVKGAVTKEEDMVDDIDDDHDGDELEIDLGEDSNLDDEDLEDESDDSKMDCGKNSAVLDPEKYQFELKKHHITKSRYGRKVFKCDICSGVYRHAFSLKRHYIRNHINLKFVSRADILNCQISPDVHDLALASEKHGDKAKYTIKEDSEDQALKSSDNQEDEMSESFKLSEMPLDGCDNASKGSAPGFDVPGKAVDGQNEEVHEVGSIENSDCKSMSIYSDNSTEDEATSVLSKQLTRRADGAVNGDKNKEELFVFSGLFRCNVCSKLFDDANDLREHLENHPNLPTSKAFACDKCDMKFSHKQNLMRHLAVHTGEKPFLCKFCGKKFPTATNQKRHERIHLGRRISCDYCTSTFTQSGDLKKHIRKLHPECFHECAFCGKYFTDEEELSEHVTSHNESLRSNEEESNRRRDAFKVDMEIDRMESMRLAEQKTPGFKFACTVCKKRFHDYANMCRHRRLAHQRHLLISHGSTSSSPVPSPTKLASDNSDSDPQAFFYANVANNISENLNNYIEGTKEDIAKAATQLKREFPPQFPPQVPESAEKVKTKVKQEKKDFVNYNFPGGFSPKENYRKVVENKDEIARILATDLKIVQQKDTSSTVVEAKSVNKEKDSHKTDEKSISDVKFMETEKLGDNVTDLVAAELKVIQTLTDLKKKDEVNKAQAALKAVDLKVANKVINLKVSKEDVESKSLISPVNGVSLNIPVFNASNLTKKEVKIQPVCTVQPIQRQSQTTTEPARHSPALAHSTKCSPPNTEKQKATSPKAPFHDKAANVKTVTSSSLKNLPAPIKTSHAPGFSLKIPQVHVCPVCRKLFNREILFRQHMMDKHKTSPEENAALNTKEKDMKNKESDKHKVLPPQNSTSGQNQPVPPMDLSGKGTETSKVQTSIDHDEGARLLLDFAMGVREEVSRTQPTVSEEPPTDASTPLDLSAALPHPTLAAPKKASVFGVSSLRDAARSLSPMGGRVFEKAPAAHSSNHQAAPTAHNNCSKPLVAHSGNKIPAAHSGNHGHNKQATVHGVLRIPNFQLSPEADLPAPLATPPCMPKSAWQPQFPVSFGTKSNPVNIKKYICTVCYSEYGSRGSLFSHQRATHPNVRCDHVEVDSDVVAPWWQKPSPVGMLNVCSSQVADLNPADQKLLICTKCSKKFSTTEDLHSHILDCADKIKKKPKAVHRPCSQSHPSHTRHIASLVAAVAGAAAAATRPPEIQLPVPSLTVHDPAMGRVGKTEDTPASATSTKPEQQQQQQQQQHHITLQQPSQQGQSKLAKMKTSILKRLKKRKSEVEDVGVVNKKKRRNPELLYNPQNHVRRREMTEVLDMQCCRGCGQHFSTISLLERHIPLCSEKDKLKTLQVSRNPIDSLSDPSEMKNLCRYCHKQFTYTGMLRKHVFEICQMRKTRIQEGSAIEEEWEHEIGQYQSGTASLETCSNDGSHLDDAASTAASTSSHDTDASNKNKRKKRKNRGWGNSKKRRTLSEGLDVSPESVDESWNPDGDPEVTGSEAAGNEDDDDFDGSVSDAELNESMDTKPDMKPMTEMREAPTELVTKAERKLGPGNEADTLGEKSGSKNSENIQEGQRNVVCDLPTAHHVNLPVETIVKSPLKTARENEPKKLKDKCLTEKCASALPFVLSVPQYTERVPPIKNKSPKSGHGERQGQAGDSIKKKKVTATKESAKKSKTTNDSTQPSSSKVVTKLDQALLGVPPKFLEAKETNVKIKNVDRKDKKSTKPLLIESPIPKIVPGSIQVISVADKGVKEQGTNRPSEITPIVEKVVDNNDEKVPSTKDLTSALKDIESKVVSDTQVLGLYRIGNLNNGDQVMVHEALVKSAHEKTVQVQSKEEPSTKNPPSSQSNMEKDTSKVLLYSPVKALTFEVQKETIKSKGDAQPLNEAAVAYNAIVPGPSKTPQTLISNGFVAAVKDATKGETDQEIMLQSNSDKAVTKDSDDAVKGVKEASKEEETDESSDEESIKEYINTFLAARRNKVNNNKSGKGKSSVAINQKTLTSKVKDQRPVLSSVFSDQEEAAKTTPVKTSPKKETQGKKAVTSPKKLKAVDKKVSSAKTKAIKKAVGTLKSIKDKSQPGVTKKGAEKIKKSPSVSPVKKKPAKPKTAISDPLDLVAQISKIMKEDVVQHNDNEPKKTVEVGGFNSPVASTEEKEIKSPSPNKQTKLKKKTVDMASPKGTPKKNSGNKDNKKASVIGVDVKGVTIPKVKKLKTPADPSKHDLKNTTTATESGTNNKKEKAAKNSSVKVQKNESPKKVSQIKSDDKNDKVENDSDSGINRNRKRKLGADSNQDGSNKSKSASKGSGPSPSKASRTRADISKGKDTESEEKITSSNSAKTNQQTRRGTRSTSSKEEQHEMKAENGNVQKAKAKKTVKKDSPAKMKRSISVITRQINDDKSDKVRGMAVPKPMRTRQSRHSL